MSIVIMGGTGVGKSTTAQVLSKKIGFPLFEIGHVVKRMYRNNLEVELHHLYTDNATIHEHIKSLVDTHSKDYFTKQRLHYVDEMVRTNGSSYFINNLLFSHSTENMIIVGVRTRGEVQAICSQHKHPYFVALTCNSDKLVNRFVERERRFMDQQAAKIIFDKRFESERERGLTEIMIECDLLLNTDYLSPEELATQILLGYTRSVLKQKQNR